SEVGIRSDLREDLYVVLGGVVNGTEQAVFRFTINPLVWWVWYGGMIVALGGLIVMWPGGAPAAKQSQAGYAVRLGGEDQGCDATTPRCTSTGARSLPWVGGIILALERRG